MAIRARTGEPRPLISEGGAKWTADEVRKYVSEEVTSTVGSQDQRPHYMDAVTGDRSIG